MSDPADLLRAAVAHHREGRLAEAEPLYRAVLEEWTGHADTWHLLGALLLQTGRFEEAVEKLSRAVELAPENPAFASNLGNALRAAGRVDEAIAVLRRALSLREDLPDAHRNLGAALRDAGHPDDAVVAFRRVVELRPGDAADYNRLGLALLEAGRTEEAETELREAVRLDALLAHAHANLGVVHRRREEWEDAIREYRTAIELAPDHADAWNNLGAILHDRGAFEESVQACRAAIGLRPDLADAHYNLAASLQELGRAEEAISSFEAAIERDPALTRAYRQLATLLTALGREEEALPWLEAWERREPEDPVLRHMLAAHRGGDVPSRASDPYVKKVFDDFAGGYEKKLEELGYRVPGLVAPALGDCGFTAAENLDVLDAGCGTGLCAPHLRPFARRLVGVDLSAGMLDRAGRRAIYDELVEAELTAFLSDSVGAFDAIVSADTFNYFGELEPLVRAAAAALRPGGVLLFTTEATPEEGGPDRELQPHGRYRHRRGYLDAVLAAAGLETLLAREEILRREANEPVPGLLFAAKRP